MQGFKKALTPEFPLDKKLLHFACQGQLPGPQPIFEVKNLLAQ